MQDEVTLANTALPLYFYELLEDVTKSRDVPGSKGIGSGPYSLPLPKDRRLQAIILLYEIGSKLDTIDKHIGGPVRSRVNPFIEDAISQFSAETGIPEEDIRRIIRRPRAPEMVTDEPHKPAGDVLDVNFRDP